MDIQIFIIQTVLSLALGSLIGLERQWHRRLVDLKTNALVSLGACLFLMTTAASGAASDFMHMAGQLVVGVGFLGGGLLFRDGGQTRGINTAATLWCCAAVGALCGLGRWRDATVAATVLVVANTLLRDLARRLNLRMGVTDHLSDVVRFEVECAAANLPAIRVQLEKTLRECRADLRAVSAAHTPQGTRLLSVSAVFDNTDTSDEIEKITQAAQSWDVLGISWNRL